MNLYLSGQICRWKNQLARTRGRKEALTNDLGQKIPRYPWSRNSCFNHFRSYWTRRNLRQRYWNHICHVQSGGSIVPSCSEIDLKTLRIFQSPYTPTHWFQYPILTYSQCWSTPPTTFSEGKKIPKVCDSWIHCWRRKWCFSFEIKKRTTILFCFQHQQTTYTFFLKYLYFKLSCGIFVIIVDNNNT